MEAGDFDAVVDVWVRSRWDALPCLEERMGYSPEDNLRHFRDVIAMENDVWIACRDGRVVALMAQHDRCIDQLFVDPAHQGRGYGSALLAKARERSPGGLFLFTHRRNERARAFYEARGFHAVAFGVSPAPESEPDVRYEWAPEAATGPPA